MLSIKINTYARRAVLFALAFLVSFSFIIPAQAQGLGGFTLESFDSVIAVHQDGTFDVEETINGEFLQARHGLFRHIPIRYTREDGSWFSIRLKVVEVTRFDAYEDFHVKEPYSIFREGAFQVIQIGDPNAVHTGPFEYKIKYQVDNALLFHDLKDELYWNVTGDDWGVPLGEVTATVMIEGVKDMRQLPLVDCLAGAVGSQEKKCRINNALYNEVKFTATEPLTVQVQFPKAIVSEPSTWKKFNWWFYDNWDWFLLIIPLVTAVFLFHAWHYHGRDPKGRGTIVAEYEPPANLLPTEIGTLIDAKVHAHDFSAAIVDLAVRGYVQIIETVEKKLGPDKKTYKFKKLSNADEALKPFEKDILQAIFGDKSDKAGSGSAGKEVELSDRAGQIAAGRAKVATKIYQNMAEQGFYVKNPRTARWTYAGIGIGIAILGHIMGLVAYSVLDRPIAHIAFFTTAGLFLLFAPFMPKRTEKGAIALEMARGFKLFLETAEKYRIEWQEKEGIFEKYLPYAMVFGVADKWAKALATQEGQKVPAWYVMSAGQTFSAPNFTNSVSSFVNSAAKVAAPSSSGGSGGSGGGSVGGGFGGGGGGSW